MMETIYGMRIVVSPALRDRYRFGLSPRLREIIAYGQPQYLEKFDDWSARFFGIEYTFLKTNLMDGPGQAIICTAAGYRHLQRLLQKGSLWRLTSST
jgi:hypothetical protein